MLFDYCNNSGKTARQSLVKYDKERERFTCPVCRQRFQHFLLRGAFDPYCPHCDVQFTP